MRSGTKLAVAAALAMTLSACGPKYPMTGGQFEALVTETFPVGSDYDRLEQALLAQGFRKPNEWESPVYRNLFGFTDVSGYPACGHHISGSLNKARQITMIQTSRVCYGAVFP